MSVSAIHPSESRAAHAHLDAVRAHFRSDHYTRINQRRLEHLATLGLVKPGMRVLELGAGIGDLTPFFLDRGCEVTLVEGRDENIAICRERYADDPRVDVHQIDLDASDDFAAGGAPWDLVFAYGVLYHLARPGEAIERMARWTGGLLLLETCVTASNAHDTNPVDEDASFASQALHGRGCRPTRAWVLERLASAFPHAYAVRTQPNHDEFPTDWSSPEPSETGLHRAVFVASRAALDHHDALTRTLPDHQPRSA